MQKLDDVDRKILDILIDNTRTPFTDIAKRLLEQKVQNINKVKPDIISTGNIGCITQIASGIDIPIIHTIEIIDWFTGGPKPVSLNKV